jgi:hypothetical protein
LPASGGENQERRGCDKGAAGGVDAVKLVLDDALGRRA